MNRRVFFAGIAGVFGMIAMNFFNPIYTDHLLEIGVPEKYIGFFFGLACLIYIIMCPIVGYMTCFVNKVYMMQLSLLVSFIALILCGPS